jgi:hypothetical protein
MVKKDIKNSIIDSCPPLSNPTIGIRAGPSRNNLTTGRRSWITLDFRYPGLMVRSTQSGARKCILFSLDKVLINLGHD